MSCDCSGCQRSKRIGELRAKQSEDGKCLKKRDNVIKKNPVSKKIVMDRYLSARKWLLRQIEWYKESHERREKNHRDYYDWFHQPIKPNTWGVKKYKEARAEAKRRGLL